MAAPDFAFLATLPPLVQIAAGFGLAAVLIAWVLPRYFAKASAPPSGDKIVLEAASIANMTPVKEIAGHLERLADAAERIAASAATREARAAEREEEEHERHQQAKVQKEIDGLRSLIEDFLRPKPPRPPHRRR